MILLRCNVVVSPNETDAETFVAWLNNNGHTGRIGTSDENSACGAMGCSVLTHMVIGSVLSLCLGLCLRLSGWVFAGFRPAGLWCAFLYRNGAPTGEVLYL